MINPLYLLLFSGLLSAGKMPDKTNRENGCHQITFTEDTTSLLRNPCMGWGLYDDASNEVQQADEYWKAQGEAASKYGSFFYIRWRWSDMEPEEGKYAWLYDDNYKKLIQGAIDRGLKLCFRIYDNGQDNVKQSTPDYVRKAGAKGYTVNGGGEAGKLWTPYPDDSVFQEKLTRFVEAFAKEYDDPGRVDFIDGYSLGWWGECHHIVLQNPANLETVFDWYTTLYASHFKNIILTLPFGSQIGFNTEKRIAIDEKGYAMRRDGLGSMWFSDGEQKIANEVFGKTLLVGESCWWGCSTDDCRPFRSDERYRLDTWRDVYELTYKQAIENHFQTLDLREMPETKGWTERANDLVVKFIAKGGYRLSPSEISVPSRLGKKGKATITHTWKNTGNGYLPNNLKSWNFKYKPAFALIDPEGNVAYTWIDEEAEPSGWFSGETYRYTKEIEGIGIPSGKYKWAVAIVDKTKGNLPGIQLAIQGQHTVHGWTVLADVKVK